MPHFNSAILMGNLTRDPELRHTPGGAAVVDFGLAVNRKWKDQSGETREEVLFIDVTAWGRVAEVVNEYVKKGDPLHVAGRLKLDQWEDKTTGAKRSKISVVAESVQLLGSRGDRAEQGSDNGGRAGRGNGGGRSSAAVPPPTRREAPVGPAADGGPDAVGPADIPF